MSDNRRLTTAEDRSPIAKSEQRMVAAAYCEDAAATLGLIATLGGPLPGEHTQLLGGIQNDLFDVAADVKSPLAGSDRETTVRIDEGYLARVRYLADHYGGQLEELSGTVIPGGTATAALVHKARTSVRLAEVHVWRAANAEPTSVNPVVASYLNELDNLLMQVARGANAEHGDLIWQPGLSAREAEEAERAEQQAN